MARFPYLETDRRGAAEKVKRIKESAHRQVWGVSAQGDRCPLRALTLCVAVCLCVLCDVLLDSLSCVALWLRCAACRLLVLVLVAAGEARDGCVCLYIVYV